MKINWNMLNLRDGLQNGYSRRRPATLVQETKLGILIRSAYPRKIMLTKIIAQNSPIIRKRCLLRYANTPYVRRGSGRERVTTVMPILVQFGFGLS